MKSILKDNVQIGVSYFTDFPGNPGIQISHGLIIQHNFRGQGYGTKFMKQRIEELRKEAKNYILCTVNPDNAPQLKLMENFGWKQLAVVVESSSPVFLFGRDVWDNCGL